MVENQQVDAIYTGGKSQSQVHEEESSEERFREGVVDSRDERSC